MPEMITDIEDYFSKGCGRCDRFATADCSTRQWEQGLLALRRICKESGLTETVKWGQPCYMHEDRNIVGFGALRGDFRLRFFNSALLKDPENLLQKQGPNTQNADMLCFTSNEQVEELEPVIKAYLQEAIGYAKAGIKPIKKQAEFELPEELIDALDADPEMADAFHSLTPGRQRSYAINLNGAKQSATRIARITKFRSKILAGKGATEY
jgi:uncharacterized protein YdeI (YjbR/CyaY-like superfamily)